MTDNTEARCDHGIAEGEECDLCYLGEGRTEACIRLAEAMCLRWERSRDEIVVRKGNQWVVWNPFFDANDDYAVLEWMHSHIFSKRQKFSVALAHELQHISEDGNLYVAWPDAAMRYQIGDYARAALKVIDDSS